MLFAPYSFVIFRSKCADLQEDTWQRRTTQEVKEEPSKMYSSIRYPLRQLWQVFRPFNSGAVRRRAFWTALYFIHFLQTKPYSIVKLHGYIFLDIFYWCEIQKPTFEAKTLELINSSA